jgi:hypothetical protein
MTAECTAVVDCCAIRVAQLTEAGIHKVGAWGYISDSQIQCKIGSEFDTINEVIVKNGCGTIITRVPPVQAVKGSTFSVDLARFDRDLLWLLVGGVRFISGGNTMGWQQALLADGQPAPVCIEVWSKAWDGTSQAVTPFSTPNVAWHHFVLPFVRCSLDPLTTNLGAATVTVNGEGQENHQLQPDGPWRDWPAPITGHGITSAFGEFEDVALPSPIQCGLQNVPSGS